MAAGGRTVWTDSPQFRQIEHLGQKLEATVGLSRGEAEVMVEAGDVGPGDHANQQTSDPGIDRSLQGIAITNHSAGLAGMFGVLGDRPRAARFHRWVLPRLVASGGRILAVLDGGQHFDGFSPGFFGGQDAVPSQSHPSGLPVDAVLDEIGPLAAGQNADAEARQVAIEEDVVFVAGFSGLDDPFGSFGHGAGALAGDGSDDPAAIRRHSHGLTWTHAGESRRAFMRTIVKAGFNNRQLLSMS